tara:strand:+ start:300 stop:830 length:531 start_codon:yes stop_codon:yes gene_type:complete
MRITESRLRRIIRQVIKESSYKLRGDTWKDKMKNANIDVKRRKDWEDFQSLMKYSKNKSRSDDSEDFESFEKSMSERYASDIAMMSAAIADYYRMGAGGPGMKDYTSDDIDELAFKAAGAEDSTHRSECLKSQKALVELTKLGEDYLGFDNAWFWEKVYDEFLISRELPMGKYSSN